MSNTNIASQKYSIKDADIWNDFAALSKNGTFLFNRNYMDYHSERFIDHSLLFLANNKTVALLPANLKDGVLYSHGGLTFGGIISGFTMRTELMLSIFDQLIQHCKNENITKIIYKPVPHIYHSMPAEEDLYALFRHNALLIGRSVTATISTQTGLKFDESRQRAIKKAKKNELIVKRSYDFKNYMQIVEAVLKERHNTNPVHSSEEMELLANRFTDNIKLYCSFKDEKMLAGVVVYQSKNVAHAQYIANSNEGRELGALELVFDYLINDCYKSCRYFDFGISTEQSGKYFNNGLMAHKEGFGARAVMHDLYEITVEK